MIKGATMVKRVKILSFCSLLLFILFSSGCKYNNMEDINKTTKTEVKTEEKLVLWTTDSNYEGINNAVKRYTEKHSDVKIDISSIPEKDIYNKAVSSMNSGVDIPDILLIERQYVSTLAKRFPDTFSDLSGDFGEFKDRFVKSQLSSMTLNNKIVALPWDTKPFLMFYRKDIFEKNEIKIEDIKTWNEYIEAGKKIFNNSEGKVSLLSLDLQKSDEFLRLTLNQLGEGYFFREDRKKIQTDNYVKALSLIKNLNSAGIVSNFTDKDKLIEDINSGSLASVLETPEFTSILMDKCRDLSGKWQLMALPAFEAGGRTAAHVNGTAFMVTTINNNTNTAFNFLKFIITDKDSIASSIVKDNIYPPIEEFYGEKWINDELNYFSGAKMWRLISETVSEIDDTCYPLDYNNIEQKLLEAQKKLWEENENVKDIAKKLLSEMPELKEK